MTISKQQLLIMGTRGVPARHGGFETFAERLALHLVERGWEVTVYCQEEGRGAIHEDLWRGIRRVHVPVAGAGAAATILFDWKATLHARREPGLVLTLGYNTAVFCAWLRLWNVPNVINMDGIEWQRRKWGALAKTWFWLNERAGCWLGDHLIADHPEIARHLATRVRAAKITMIPYGADRLDAPPIAPLAAFGLEPGRYLTVIARPEPENSLLEIVAAFSARPRGCRLVVLGRYEPERNPYHRAVLRAAGPEVAFVGAIYERDTVQALRYHGLAYVHGHQVGGTNPSLVEAMGAGNAIVAHDNRFNRWVAGSGALYFGDAAELARRFDELLAHPAALATRRAQTAARFAECFTWGTVLAAYEDLLAAWLPREAIAAVRKN